MLPCPAPDTCLLILIRHGATANNIANPIRIQGRRSDLELSAEGRQQAEETARFLEDGTIDAIYATPLLRARQTAEPIARRRGANVTIVDELTEVDVGQWEGMSWHEIQQAWPEEHGRFMADPSCSPYLGGENLEQVQRRVVPAIDGLLARHLGQTIVVVTHNVVNRVYLAPLLGVPLARARGIFQENCGINLVRHRAGRSQLISLNIVTHLSRW
jgi:broad specificity phosphatase PhoE